MSSLEALPAVPHASPSLQALSQVATQAAAGELPSQPHPIDADAGALLGLQAVGALPVGALPVGALPLPPLAAAAVDHDQNAPMVPSSAAAAPPAVSSEWHVHCVKEVPSPAADGQTRQLCIQCPNGRRHSSIFLVGALRLRAACPPPTHPPHPTPLSFPRTAPLHTPALRSAAARPAHIPASPRWY